MEPQRIIFGFHLIAYILIILIVILSKHDRRHLVYRYLIFMNGLYIFFVLITSPKVFSLSVMYFYIAALVVYLPALFMIYKVNYHNLLKSKRADMVN